MNDTDCLRHRSGEQWIPTRTSTLTISVIDRPPVAPRPGAGTVPFGFGIRDEPIVEWEGNPS